MGVPSIPTKSPLATLLANTLGTTVKSLYKKYGYKAPSGERRISVVDLKYSRAYGNWKRITKGQGYGKCENTYLIDNGDGAIGNGDLYLHADGFYVKDGRYFYRYVKLGDSYSVQKGKQDDYKNPDLTKEAHEVLKKIEDAKGQPFNRSTFIKIFKKACK
jgi:hypothetical protein